jgi:AcrR family transcriptional regulator
MVSTEEAPRKLQTRGEERRNKILICAKEMLENKEEISLSIYDVAKISKIPASSIYHFFPKADDIIKALLDEILLSFDECISDPIDISLTNNWTDICYLLEERMLNIYNNNELARRVILGQHTYGELLVADQFHDQKMGEQLVQLYNRYFELPTLPTEFNVFTIAMQISDKVYAMSHQQHGYITEAYAQQGWLVAKAYLGLYLPSFLPKK